MNDTHEQSTPPGMSGAGLEVAATALTDQPSGDFAVSSMLAEADRLFASGQLEEAGQTYTNILDLSPGQPQAMNKLGIIAVREGRPTDAEGFFRKAIVAAPTYAPPYSNLGNLLREQGDLIGALRLYEKAVEVDPDYAAAYHNQGVVYRQMGRYDKSIPLLKKAARLEMKRPASGDAHPFQLSRLGANRILFWLLIILGAILVISLRK